jgi:hypothetical protein
MNSNPAGYGYSACVELQLIVGERIYDLHAIGPGRICLRDPAELAPCEALVVMQVDGHEDRWPVYLPDGLSANKREARTVPHSAAPARSAGQGFVAP